MHKSQPHREQTSRPLKPHPEQTARAFSEQVGYFEHLCFLFICEQPNENSFPLPPTNRKETVTRFTSTSELLRAFPAFPSAQHPRTVLPTLPWLECSHAHPARPMFPLIKTSGGRLAPCLFLYRAQVGSQAYLLLLGTQAIEEKAASSTFWEHLEISPTPPCWV